MSKTVYSSTHGVEENSSSRSSDQYSPGTFIQRNQLLQNKKASTPYLAIVEADLHATGLDDEDLDRSERDQVRVGRHRLLEGPRRVLARVQTWLQKKIYGMHMMMYVMWTLMRRAFGRHGKRKKQPPVQIPIETHYQVIQHNTYGEEANHMRQKHTQPARKTPIVPGSRISNMWLFCARPNWPC